MLFIKRMNVINVKKNSGVQRFYLCAILFSNKDLFSSIQ